MDRFCLENGKRCIMWDDDGAGFYLVRVLLSGRGRNQQRGAHISMALLPSPLVLPMHADFVTPV